MDVWLRIPEKTLLNILNLLMMFYFDLIYFGGIYYIFYIL